MRVLFWHGYLLGGTGSNVYTQAVAREWSRAGHDVVVLCQEPHPERFDLAGARVVRPHLPFGLLPVFVVDRYEDLQARPLQDLTLPQRDRYVAANAEAVREHLPGATTTSYDSEPATRTRAAELGLADTVCASAAEAVREATQREREEQARLSATEDFQEGVRAVAERREPDFSGR